MIRNGNGIGVLPQRKRPSMVHIQTLSVMTKLQHFLTLAGQGNAKAIAAILSRSLKPDGIRAIAKLEQGCLHVILEGNPIPDRAFSWYVSERVEGFGSRSIESIRVYGRQIGSQTISWESEMVAANTINVFDAEAIPELLAQPSSAAIEDRDRPNTVHPNDLAILQPFENLSASGFAEGFLATEGIDPAVANAQLGTPAASEAVTSTNTDSRKSEDPPTEDGAISFFAESDATNAATTPHSANENAISFFEGNSATTAVTSATDSSTTTSTATDSTATDSTATDSTHDNAVSFFNSDSVATDSDRLTQSSNGASSFEAEDNNTVTDTAEFSQARQDETMGSFWGEDNSADNVDFGNVDFGEETVAEKIVAEETVAEKMVAEKMVAEATVSEETVAEAIGANEPDLSALPLENTFDAFTAEELEALAEDLPDDPLDAFTQDELAELAKAQQSQPLSTTAIAIAIAACAALSVLGGLYLYRGRLFPQSTQPEASPSQVASPPSQPKPSPSPKISASPVLSPKPSPTASATPKPSPTASPATQASPSPTVSSSPTTKSSPTTSPSPQNSPSSTPSPSSQGNPFQKAVNQALEAATLTQSANTEVEWQTVADRWQDAIALMAAVPQSNPKYKLAQNKVVEYQKNLDYANQRIAALSP